MIFHVKRCAGRLCFSNEQDPSMIVDVHYTFATHKKQVLCEILTSLFVMAFFLGWNSLTLHPPSVYVILKSLGITWKQS